MHVFIGLFADLFLDYHSINKAIAWYYSPFLLVLIYLSLFSKLSYLYYTKFQALFYQSRHIINYALQVLDEALIQDIA